MSNAVDRVTYRSHLFAVLAACATTVSVAQPITGNPDMLWESALDAHAAGDHEAAWSHVNALLEMASIGSARYIEALKAYPEFHSNAEKQRATNLERQRAETEESEIAKKKRDTAAAIQSISADMVAIPAGILLLSPRKGTTPARSITMLPFWIGRHEVTFDEFDKFTETTGRPKVPDFGFGRGNRPVINVNVDDVLAFLDWLSKETGIQHRLPSEAEWEYTARANADAKTVADTGCNDRNGSGAHPQTGPKACRDVWTYIAPVAKFPQNAFGLYDMRGNVWEWTEDCWNTSAFKNATDSKPSITGDCGRRVLRGGSWSDPAKWLTLTTRTSDSIQTRSRIVGFRIVRERALPASRSPS